MSTETLREQVDNAVEQAIIGDADLDEIETILDDAQTRLDEVRAFRSGGESE
jgi:hypothetical protein